jgi:hypothetical protein
MFNSSKFGDKSSNCSHKRKNHLKQHRIVVIELLVIENNSSLILVFCPDRDFHANTDVSINDILFDLTQPIGNVLRNFFI